MSAYILQLRGEEKERHLSWVSYASSLMVQPAKQQSQLSAVKKADESRQDLHSSAKAQQSDRQPWNYKPCMPQQQTRIDQANAIYKRKQKE